MNHILLNYVDRLRKSLTFLFFFLPIFSLCIAQTTSNSVNGSWRVPNEKDDYHNFISIPQNASPGYVRVHLTQNDEDLKPAMVISRDLNKSGAIISGSSVKTNNSYNRTAYFSVHPGMTYSVRVYPFFNADTKDYPVPYTLSWEFTDRPDAYEPNDTRNDAKPIRLNEPIEAYAIAGYIKQSFIGSADDNTYDWYEVTLGASDRLSAEILQKPTDLDLNLRFITPAGRQVGTETVSTGNIKKIRTRDALSPGTYYLEVHQRMKGPRKSEKDTQPIPDHFNTPYRLIVSDSKGVNSVSQNSSGSTPLPAPTAQGYTIADLAGLWERRASNIRSWNGLQIRVSGTEGTVIDKAGSLFENGDVKWSALQKSGTDTFTYKELATDGNYYSATIKFISKHELEVRVDSDASGNTQIWTRVSNKTVNPGRLSLASLQGKWRLVRSNNGNYDGMVVQLEGTTGTIVVEKIGGNYTKGSVKWKDITLVKGNEYAFTDINAQGTSTISVIRINDENQLNIRLGASIAGNDQIWERLDGNSNSEAITNQKLPCSINADTKLINTGRDVDYIVDCVIHITASLTIEPGVVIEFGEGAGLGVYDKGKLVSMGTATDKIVFRGKENRPGYWRGIHMETMGNEMGHVNVSAAGSNYVYCCNGKAAVFVKRGDLKISNSYIHDNAGCGILKLDNAVLDEQGNTFAGNIEGHICYGKPRPVPNKITDATTLVNSPRDIDYYVPANQVTDVTATLTIEPGVVIEFEENSGLGIYDEGQLISVGSAAQKIVFQGKEKRPGFWRGVHIETTGNRMEHMVINSTGSNYVYCCNGKAAVFVKRGDLKISQSYIHDNAGCGILKLDNAVLDEQGNTFAGNIEGHICYGKPRPVPNKITDATTLVNSPRDIDYYVPANQVTDVTATLTIEPGVVIEFEENSGLGIYDEGQLISVGSAAQKIVFQGKEKRPGFWRGVHIETTGNRMEHVDISSAGSRFVYCCNTEASIFLKSGYLDISHSYIHDNSGCGIFVRGGGTLAESGNTFAANAEGHICN